MEWMSAFNDRQRKEIQFSILYEDKFNHGTDGHNSKIIIAEMAKLLMLIAQGSTLEQATDEVARNLAVKNRP